MIANKPTGIGLGLRQEFLFELADLDTKLEGVDFLELAPENWIGVGGRRQAALACLAEKYPLVCHGLSLSIGSPAPLNIPYLHQLKAFLDQYDVLTYSEHLSYCSDEQGQLYDLLPLPFTEETVQYVAGRIQQVQAMLGRRVAFENISYYCAPSQAMSESAFIQAVLERADCDLLLDINNIYVNSINHGYDADDFLASMPSETIAYLHIAGHRQVQENLLLDTHGEQVMPRVWRLLQKAYDRFGILPTLLERDHHITSLADVLEEAAVAKEQQQKALCQR